MIDRQPWYGYTAIPLEPIVEEVEFDEVEYLADERCKRDREMSIEAFVSIVLALASLLMIGVGMTSAVYLDCRYPPNRQYLAEKEVCLILDIKAR